MTDNETNLTLLNVNQIVSLLSRAYIKLIKNGTPLKSFPSVMLWGPPGIGKSQGVREIAGNIQAKTGKKGFHHRCTPVAIQPGRSQRHPDDQRG